MICGLCDKEMPNGETVVFEQYGYMVDGQFQAIEEPSIRHEDCGGDD